MHDMFNFNSAVAHTDFSSPLQAHPAMATSNILKVFPVEIFEHVFSLLSKSRSDIGACRLTCRDFHLISSPYLLPSVVLADNLDAIHKTQQIIEHPYFSRHVTELIYVPDHYDHEDDHRYETALKKMDCQQDEDKLLWQDLTRYSDYRGKGWKGPERCRCFDESAFDRHSLRTPDFQDYIRAIRMNMLEKLLKTLPKLRNVTLTDFSSVCREGLIGSTRKVDAHAKTDWFWRSAYGDYDHEISTLILCVSQIRGSDIKSITFGPSLFENSMAYWEERRDKTGMVDRAGPSYHLDLAVIGDLWNDYHDELQSVMRGLRRLHLPIDLYTSDKATLLTTSFPSFMELAAPSITHLTLDAKGLIRDGTPRDDLGLLGFEAFFGKLHMPHLTHFDLLGWVYTQAQLQRFLVRHAGPLRELRLMQNAMLEGDVVALADFGSDRLSLTGIELDWGADRRGTPEDVKIRDESRSSFSMPERWLESRWQSPSLALELRWLGGRSNQIVRARQWRCDQYMSSSTLYDTKSMN